MQYRKLTAIAVVLSLCISSAAALMANASSDGVTIVVDSMSIPQKTLMEQEYKVYTYVWLAENAGINYGEFGIEVDPRCTYRVVEDAEEIQNVLGEPLILDAKMDTDELTWYLFSQQEITEETGPLMLLEITLPESSKPGDVYTVRYVDQRYRSHAWGYSQGILDEAVRKEYVKEGTVSWMDGTIAVITAENQYYQSPLTYQLYEDHAEVVECNMDADYADIQSQINGLPVTSVAQTAFQDHDKLKHVIMPDSITQTEGGIFSGCTALEEVRLSENLTALPFAGTNTDGKGYFEGCTRLRTLHIPDHVQEIGCSAFRYCYRLTDLQLPADLQTIGGGYAFDGTAIPRTLGAFEGCAALQTITVPEGTQSIGAYAFYGCTTLQSVTFPVSLQSVAERAFADCIRLQDVYYAGSAQEWDSLEIAPDNWYLFGASMHYDKQPAETEIPTEAVTEPSTTPETTKAAAPGTTTPEATTRTETTTQTSTTVTKPASTTEVPVTTTTTTTTGMERGDLNGDHEVDASDASLILMYAAAYGAGLTQTLDEFLEQIL